MKKYIIAFIGHIIIAGLHYYSIKINGMDWFQFISFAIVHYIWHDSLVNNIYGLK